MTPISPFPRPHPLLASAEAWLGLVLPPRGRQEALPRPSVGTAPLAAGFGFHLQGLVSRLSGELCGNFQCETRPEKRARPSETEDNGPCVPGECTVCPSQHVPILPFSERPLDLARRCESSLCPFEKCVWLPHPGVSFSRPRMKAIPWKCNVQEGQASVSQAVRGQNPSCRNRRPTDAAGHIPATLTNGRFCASPSESQADLDRELCELWASL